LCFQRPGSQFQDLLFEFQIVYALRKLVGVEAYHVEVVGDIERGSGAND
jgi:hypothetical protein